MSQGLAQAAVDELSGTGTTSPEVVARMVAGIADGTVSDAQAAGWLVAIRCRGLDDECSAALVDSMVASSERLHWDIDGPVVDKHSTGGVGDKVSLVVVPLAASLGLSVPMLSGRGLGHTGGTLDKLEAIAGFQVELDIEHARRVLAECGCFIAGASDALAVADRRMYALRDHIGCVSSVPLIAASIVSKKIAGGGQGLVVDTRYGNGAFLGDEDEARELAAAMQVMAERAGMHFVAMLSSHDRVLGASAGNACEVQEAMDVLGGGGPDDVIDWSVGCVQLMGEVGGVRIDRSDCLAALADGRAMEVFERMVVAQGGDLGAGVAAGSHRVEVRAREAGWVDVSARDVAQAAWLAGAGRTRRRESVDSSAGVRLLAVGERVDAGDVIAAIEGCSIEDIEHAAKTLDASIGYSETAVPVDSYVTWRGESPTREVGG